MLLIDSVEALDTMGIEGKLLLFIDRAAQHHSSIMIRKHSEENKDVIRVEYVPQGSPEYNAVEEIETSKYYSIFPNLKVAIANYLTKRFKLDITKYLLKNVS